MQVIINMQGQTYHIDLSKPLDISIPLHDGYHQANAFYAPFLQIEAVRSGDFIGDTSKGGPVNFKNVMLNPHGNGTHTECVGHIAKEVVVLTDCLKQFFYKALLITLYPTLSDNGDKIINSSHLELLAGDIEDDVNALIIRTLPNTSDKLKQHYSGTNPTYMDANAAQWLVDHHIQHLLIDLPSIDREEDGGRLAAHHNFWEYPHNTRYNATITEMIYVPNEIKDGYYFLQMQITSLQLDASPSMPLLYAIH